MTRRVVHVSTVPQGGGAARVAKVLHERQRSRGVDSVLLCGLGTGDEATGVETLGIEPWRHHANALMQRITGREGVLNHGSWERAFRRFVEPAEVIHLHNAHGYYLPRHFLRKILERPTVWTLHDEWLLTGRCAFPLDCEGFRTGCDPCPYPERYPAAWIDHAAKEFPRRRELGAQANALFVTPSEMIRDRFIGEGFPEERFEVIPNPLDLEREVSVEARLRARQALGLPLDRTVVLFVAAESWVPRKGIDVFAAATRQLREPGAWQICVVGALNREVTATFADHPVPSRLVGKVSDRDHLTRYYLASDIMVAPSRSESFGLIVIEAAGMGCEVVCTDLPVFREILGDGGHYFPFGDAKACAAALEALAAGGKPAPPLSRARSIRERFALDQITDRYLSAYETVLGWQSARRTG